MFMRAAIVCASLLFVSNLAMAQSTQIVQTQPAAAPTSVILQAAPVQAPALLVDERPSPFRHAMQGMLAGAMAGSGVGYLAVHDGYHGEAHRDVLLGAGIGALSGMGLGLGLGVLDATERNSPVRYVMRDALYGTALGGVFGLTTGGLVALDSNDAEDVLVGGAIGSVAGLLLGGVVGVLEGQWPRIRRQPTVTTTVVVSHDQSGQRLLIPGVRGRF